tara:strand:- start:487 stop:729 length:243 start_codon:yes stop_codon:yes gene_type:complete
MITNTQKFIKILTAGKACIQCIHYVQHTENHEYGESYASENYMICTLDEDLHAGYQVDLTDCPGVSEFEEWSNDELETTS